MLRVAKPHASLQDQVRDFRHHIPMFESVDLLECNRFTTLFFPIIKDSASLIQLG